jgi:hypothetical protein
VAYTEFYCNASTGSNMNGGSDENASPSYTATNGGWNSGTGVFTPASGNPSSSVTVGQFANVFTDGATTPVFVGRVTSVNSTTVTVSTTAKAGTAPNTGASGISINVGGVWKGPNAAVSFPLNFIVRTTVNASSDWPRVNFKNNATYSVTASVTQGNSGIIVFQGYSSTVGDGGKATIDGGTTGASFILFNNSGSGCRYRDLIFQNNGDSSNSGGVVSAAQNIYERVVVNSIRGHGFSISGHLIECEAYSCNQSNGGFVGISVNTGTLVRCISHNNTGNASGFGLGNAFAIDCIADTNGASGFASSSTQPISLLNCTAYNNTVSGFVHNSGFQVTVAENCVFASNGAYGVNFASSNGRILNCAFYSNTSGSTNGSTDATGSITLSVSPFVDAANGDFSLNDTDGGGADLRGTGIGTFQQTSGYSDTTTSYPDIGAVQHQEISGGLLMNPGMTGGMN